MLISVVCPVLNEAKNIQELIDFFIHAEPEDKELILIDGGSHDNTIKIIQANGTRYSNVKLLHNPHKIVPYALNLAIPICRGTYIVRLDGHSRYAHDYFLKILEAFSKSDAGIVGGPTRTQYTTLTQEAIAFAVSHPMGIGNSKVHNEKYEGYSDSVTFGAWKNSIFETTGLFDTRLVRNQDDEFHYRAKSRGIKIYQYPPIRLYYSPRSNFNSLFKQYFQYGLYKPLVLKKIKSEIKLRHLIPSLFVCYLIAGIFFMDYWFYFLPLALYGISNIYVSFFNIKSVSVKLRILMALPCIHVAYGIGFLLGILKTFRR
jgi:succinoglycan biosynthesis protein ExoA